MKNTCFLYGRFPYKNYAFCDQRLSVLMDYHGNITNIRYNSQSDDTIMSILTGESGLSLTMAEAPLWSDNMTIFPSGLICSKDGAEVSSLFNFLIAENTLWWHIPAPTGEVCLRLRKDALIREFDELTDEGTRRQRCSWTEDMSGNIFFSFRDKGVVRRQTCWTAGIEIATPELPPLEYDVLINLRVACNVATRVEDDGDSYLLRADGNGEAIVLAISIAEGDAPTWPEINPTHVDALMDTAIQEFTAVSETYPEAEICEGYHINRFAATYPAFISSLYIKDSGAIRADNWGYWAWGWDMINTMIGMLAGGDYDKIKRSIQFLSNARREDGGIAHAFSGDYQHYYTCTIGGANNLCYIWFIGRYLEVTNDTDLANTVYPQIKQIFAGIAALTNETGMFPTRGLGTDHPHEFGRTSFAYVSLEMGWWYESLRVVERLARLQGDEETAENASTIARRLRSSFLDILWSDEYNFLLEAAHPLGPITLEDSGMTSSIPTITNIGCMGGLYGEELVFDRLAELSTFASDNLVTNEGIRYSPAWEKRGFYKWTMVTQNWFPLHDINAAKLLRLTGDGNGLARILNAYDNAFGRYDVVFEGMAFERPLNTYGKLQGFAASGWYRVMMETLAGIQPDSGGLTYLPCDFSSDISLKSYKYGNTVWDISVKGHGPFIKCLEVDGQPLNGTCKVPKRLMSPGRHTLEITRGYHYHSPLLINAVNAEVVTSETADGLLKATLKLSGYTPITFYSPTKPMVLLNGQPTQDAKWNAKTKRGLLIVETTGEVAVEVNAGQ